MEQKKGKGKGFLDGGETRPASPQEFESEMGGLRATEWRENPGGGSLGNEIGSRVARGHRHPGVE